MKKTTTTVAKELKAYTLKAVFIACLLSLATLRIHSQVLNPEKYHVGLGLSNYITTNGHGAFYSSFVSVSKGRGMVTLGACLQKRTTEINGGRLSFSYLLASRNDDDELPYGVEETQEESVLQLRFLSYLQYLDRANLSYNRARVETITNVERAIDWNKVKMSTAEAGLGVELDIKLKYFTVRNFITLSGYYHINYIEGMYHEKCSPALTLGTGIVIPKF
jgi:hypothetical protein